MADQGAGFNERIGERRHYSLRDFSTIVVLLLNFGALVWGAATMSNSLRSLRDTVNEVKGTMATAGAKIDQIQLDYSARMAVLENRVSANERAISEINRKVRGY